MGLDWNDRRRFKENAATEQDLEMLKAMVYVLYAMKIHILSLQDPTVANDTMVCQVLGGLMSLLKTLSRGAVCPNSEELHKISVFKSKISPESLALCKPHSKVRRKFIAILLMEAIKLWLDHTMIIPYLQLSFFNLLWAAQHYVSWVASQSGPTQSKRDTNAVDAAMKEWYKNIIAHKRTYAGGPGANWREMGANIILDEGLPVEKPMSPTKIRA